MNISLCLNIDYFFENVSFGSGFGWLMKISFIGDRPLLLRKKTKGSVPYVLSKNIPEVY